MAITIQAQPTSAQFVSVGNPIELLISSTQTAQPNFKIDIKVYYDPAGVNTLIANLKYDTIPSTTQILADVSKILKSRISENITNLRTSATGIKTESLKTFDANVVAAEYYGSTPALQASGTSNTFKVFNGSFKYRGWQRGDVAHYRMVSGAASVYTKRLLTGWDNYVAVTLGTVVAAPQNYFAGQYHVRKINAAQLAQISFLWEGSAGTNKSVTLYYHGADFTPSLFSGTLSLASAAGLTSLNIGTAAIIAGGGGTLGSLDSTAKYLSLMVKDNGNDRSATYLYEIDWSPCSRFDNYEIHWLNRDGGFDSWVFSKRSKVETIVERKQFNPNSLPISGSTIVHNSYDIKGKNFVVSTKERYTVRSNYLKGWELDGLEDLITSPLIYWNSPDGFINITIEDPTVLEHKTNTVDKLFNLAFAFEIDNQDIRQ